MTPTLRRTALVTGLASFMASLDNLVVMMALPAIQREFSVDIHALSWAVNAYTIPFAVFMLAAAVLGERYGRQRVFMIGVLTFGAGSLGAFLAPGMATFLAARAVQGVGAAIVVPLSLTLLVSQFSAERRHVATATISAVQGLAIALGPFVGGLVVQVLSWQWVFGINLPVVALVLLLGTGRGRAVAPAPVRAHLDLPGLVLLSLALTSLTYGLVTVAERPENRAVAVLALVGGAVAVFVFVRWESTTARPSLPPRLFRSRGFRRANLTAALATSGMFGIVFILTQYLQQVLDYAPLSAGVATLPWTLLPAVSAPVAAVLVGRVGIRRLVVLGTALQVTAITSFLLVVGPEVGYLALLPGMVLAGLGMGVFYALITAQALAFTRRSDEGLASGVNNAVRESGVLYGVALVATVFGAAGGSTTRSGFIAGTPWALGAALALLVAALVSALLTPTEPIAAPEAQDPPDHHRSDLTDLPDPAASVDGAPHRPDDARV